MVDLVASVDYVKSMEAKRTASVNVSVAPADARAALDALEADFQQFLAEQTAVEQRLALRIRQLRERLEIAATRTAPEESAILAGRPTGTFDPEEAGLAAVAALQAAEGGSWTGAELAERFGLTSATLHRRRKERRIVYWRDALHEFHYPKWQFTETGALMPGLREMLQTLASDDEWRVMSYFLGRREQLGDRRPVDLLRAGEQDALLTHAKRHVAENTW